MNRLRSLGVGFNNLIDLKFLKRMRFEGYMDIFLSTKNIKLDNNLLTNVIGFLELDYKKIRILHLSIYYII